MNKTIMEALAELFCRSRSSGAFESQEEYARYLAWAEPSLKELDRQRNRTFKDPVRFIISLSPGVGAGKTLASIKTQTYGNYVMAEAAVPEDADFIIALKAGDVLTPDALYSFAEYIERHKGVQLVYSDEDRLSASGREAPCFKPDYSEITALSYDLIGRAFAVSFKLYNECGGAAAGDLTLADNRYPFMLRCLAAAKHAGHIPKVLLSTKEKEQPVSISAAEEGMNYYFSRTGQQCETVPGLWRGSFRISAKSKPGRVAIVIPNRDHEQELRRLLESIEETCAFHKPEIVVADGGSTSPKTLRYYDILKKNRLITVVNGEGGFAALCNAGANAADADAYLFLSRDAELLTPDIIGVLAEQGARRNVGAVGCTVLGSTMRLLYAGGVPGFCGPVESPFAGASLDKELPHMNKFVRSIRSVSTLSGACMYVSSDLFHGSDGFDESFDVEDELMPCGADAEFSLRLMKRGFSNVYTPYARVILHRELVKVTSAPEKVKTRAYDVMRPYIVEGDPNFNPNFSMNALDLKSAPCPMQELHSKF